MPRPLTPDEINLVAFILGQHSPSQDHFGLVEEMNDGGWAAFCLSVLQTGISADVLAKPNLTTPMECWCQSH
jgi:hypothetical protein